MILVFIVILHGVEGEDLWRVYITHFNEIFIYFNLWGGQ